MPGPSMFLLLAFVIGVVAIWIVARHVKLKVELNLQRSGVDLRSLLAFTKERHDRIGEYMRANWSGTAEHLPQVLRSLLEELERDVRARGLAIDRESLKSMMAASIRAHRIGPAKELGEAMAHLG